MGAKQSKRSVDISGKEGEGAGEVAAAGAGGEGRVEALADVDALKPQANGDAHIHDTDKEKQLDSDTPENEKDATTEKEGKEQQAAEKEKEIEVVPVTNGDSEPKENGESSPAAASAPAPEDGKKPKKEKVKKKWSLRSISFSRKDKPKQEKKQKDEEHKSNGEPEKVPEEAAEASPENGASEIAEEAKPEAEAKDEKTPETPVTEPLTNGSSTPDSQKAETPAVEAAPVSAPVPVEAAKPELKAEIVPEQLPVNGLSLEEPKVEASAAAQSEESKPEKTIVETTETVPASEIPVKIEVCVEKMPLESMPPPLPANPPPSSVVSFAATTMAPELTDASLANTADLTVSTLPLVPSTDVNNHDTIAPEPQIRIGDVNSAGDACIDEFKSTLLPSLKDEKDVTKMEPGEIIADNNQEVVENVVEMQQPQIENFKDILERNDVDNAKIAESVNIAVEANNHADIGNIPEVQKPEIEKVVGNTKVLQKKEEQTVTLLDLEPDVPEYDVDAVDDLPPPPSPLNDDMSVESDIIDKSEKIQIVNQTIIIANHISDKVEANGLSLDGTEETEQANLKNKTKDLLDNVSHELNGNVDDIIEPHEARELITVTDMLEECVNSVATPSESTPPSLSEASESLPAAGASETSDALPPPPADLAPAPQYPPQEPLPVSDKLADLIPEVPVVPDLPTETLQETNEVALAN